jgi:hypothetical protein
MSWSSPLDTGFRTGTPAIVIATRDHWQRFAAALEAGRWDVQTGVFPDVFPTHTRGHPAVDTPTLAAALDQALVEIAGPITTARVSLHVAGHVPRETAP